MDRENSNSTRSDWRWFVAIHLFLTALQCQLLMMRTGICIHHFQLLPPSRAAGLGSPARPASQSSGTGAAALPVRAGWLRGHAKTSSSADQRTGKKESFNCDTGHQAELHTTGVGRAVPKSARHRAPLAFLDLHISHSLDTMRHRHEPPACNRRGWRSLVIGPSGEIGYKTPD